MLHVDLQGRTTNTGINASPRSPPSPWWTWCTSPTLTLTNDAWKSRRVIFSRVNDNNCSPSHMSMRPDIVEFREMNQFVGADPAHAISSRSECRCTTWATQQHLETRGCGANSPSQHLSSSGTDTTIPQVTAMTTRSHIQFKCQSGTTLKFSFQSINGRGATWSECGGGTVWRKRTESSAHKAKKMRPDDDDVELFTTVHNEIAEITGDLLPADLMHAAHEK